MRKHLQHNMFVLLNHWRGFFFSTAPKMSQNNMQCFGQLAAHNEALMLLRSCSTVNRIIVVVVVYFFEQSNFSLNASLQVGCVQCLGRECLSPGRNKRVAHTYVHDTHIHTRTQRPKSQYKPNHNTVQIYSQSLITFYCF